MRGDLIMNEYHKIDSIFKRDMSKPNAPFITGEYSTQEIGYLKDNQWEFTEKVDGTNIRVLYQSGTVVFKGKSDKAEIPPHLLAKLGSLLPCEKMTEVFGETDVCLYGEGFGYKIQGKVGIDYLKDDVGFYLFDVKIGQWWLKREDVENIAAKLEILAPVCVGYGNIDDAIWLVKQGFKSRFGTAEAEGIVLRPTVELLNRGGERIITKVKTRDFR
jgi:ATP-dependent RNA circularization protein (DNA/RNA ligase family)